MKGTNDKSVQIHRTSIDKIDIYRIASLLLEGSRCKGKPGKEGWSRPQLTYMLKNAVSRLNKANIEILELKSVIDAATPVIQIFAEQLNKLK